MPRYFLEVAYKGTAYSGFQIQQNAVSVQGEIEKALAVLHRRQFALTGSSRTDAGVHALQNFFHFDDQGVHEQAVYKLNSLLPRDISIIRLLQMPPEAHSRFDAVSRSYEYRIHRFKNPFRNELSCYFPYNVNEKLMNEAAQLLMGYTDFTSFSKSNTQTKTNNCRLTESRWEIGRNEMTYFVTGNRFLRGMVRLLVGSMLKVGREKLTIEQLHELIAANTPAGFSVPAQGLYLASVQFPKDYLPSF